jgi:hypothetical protein
MLVELRCRGDSKIIWVISPENNNLLSVIGYWLFAQRYLSPEVLIDSTNCRWKMKKSKSVGSATMVDPAMI